jgi:hypothetical protein
MLTTARKIPSFRLTAFTLAVIIVCFDLPKQVQAADESVRPGIADAVINEINSQIRTAWKDNEVEPSPQADDSEWMRRVYLDVIGHIPSLDDVEKFLADKDRAKRKKLVDRLLDDPGYSRNWTTIWTNLCIGQQTPRRVSREGMQKFFREAFGKNRPWKDIVVDLVTAEGHFEENGAVNFLLAQMQDQDGGVQMTAKTTRLFMGMQLQCTQCHDHPYNEWKQDQFWQFNSFFRQTGKRDHRKFDQTVGRMVDDYSEIVDRDFSGPVYFEKRNGLMKVAYPVFFGADVEPSGSTDRRKELARLMTTGDRPLIAPAYINRIWAHFFGFGFTNPIDDISSHIPVTHPELFNRLSDEFVKGGYDCKQVIRWIANSAPYNLTSRSTKKNTIDNPSIGEAALFTHVYVKPMTAEQLYDSLIVATNAHKTGRSDWEKSEQQRREWLDQFIRAFGTDDGGESTSFDGTIPQALVMMNGALVRDAISIKPGSHLYELLSGQGEIPQKIRKLYLTALGRNPTKQELATTQKFFDENADPLPVFQDLFWALLNCNEFIFNH